VATSDKWYSRAVPVLEAIDAREGVGNIVSIGDLAHATGLDPDEIGVEVERLIADGFVDVQEEVLKPWTARSARPWTLVSPRLAERGARVVGAWPAENPYEALVEIIERRIAAAEDELERSRWQRMLDTIVTLARDVGSNVVASVLVELGKAGI
jgi:hypothetical protein